MLTNFYERKGSIVYLKRTMDVVFRYLKLTNGPRPCDWTRCAHTLRIGETKVGVSKLTAQELEKCESLSAMPKSPVADSEIILHPYSIPGNHPITKAILWHTHITSHHLSAEGPMAEVGKGFRFAWARKTVQTLIRPFGFSVSEVHTSIPEDWSGHVRTNVGNSEGTHSEKMGMSLHLHDYSSSTPRAAVPHGLL